MAAAVDLWSVDVAAAAPALLALDADLGFSSEADRQAAARLQSAETGRQRLALRVAVRLLIERRVWSRHRGVPFDVGPGGKPTLPGAGCHFSLAHVQDRGLIALSSTQVGVDLETIRGVDIDAQRRVLIEAAAEALGGAGPLPPEPAKSFLQAWSRLEALAKADGRGIGHVLAEIGAFGPNRSGARAGVLRQSASLAALAAAHIVYDLGLGPRHLGALAVRGGCDAIGPIAEMPCDKASLHELCSLRTSGAPPQMCGR